LKSIDPIVIVGQLVAAAADVEYTVDTVRTTGVWSPDITPWPGMEDGEPTPDSDWEGVTGPWVEELDDRARDVLADVEDSRVANLAEQWARIEEFGASTTGAELEPIVEDLIGLARRARKAGDHLYCWSS